MSHPWLPHLPFTTSTSSSSFTLPSTTTPEHALQSGQHDLLQEHSVHPAHLQAPSVDKLRHQESLWREDLQSGGNPRTTTPTGYNPKEFATVSRIEDYSGDPYQLYDVQKNLEKKITELLSPKKWRNLERLGHLACWILKYQRRPTSNRRCISTIPWKALQILISEVESYKQMLTSPLHAEKSFGETRCNDHAGERGKRTKHSSRSKGKFEGSLI